MNQSASHGERLCLPVRCLRSRMGGRADRSECARERDFDDVCCSLLRHGHAAHGNHVPTRRVRSNQVRARAEGRRRTLCPAPLSACPRSPPPPFAASPPQIHNQNEFPANARTAAPHLGSDYHTHTTNHLACTSERFESQLSLLKSLVCLFNKYTLTGYSRSIVRLP